MTEKHKQNLKERGITLVALVITIIVLLILAGVTLATLTGDSGILNNAENAKNQTNIANAKEQVALAVQGARIEGVGTITTDKLKAELDSVVGAGKYELSEGEESWTIKVGDYETTVSKVEKEVVTNYTAEEIEANEHLYAIGSTVSTYVVAEFNEDYTAVTITKNGEESDGKIADFAPWKINSPMSTHKSTLKTAIIKNGVTNTGSGSGGGGMFIGCTELINVQTPSSVIYIGNNTFYGCTGLTNIKIPNSVTTIQQSAFSKCTGLTSIEIPNSVTSIARSAFSGCTGLTSIEILNSVTSISEGAFENTGYYNESGNWENDVLYIGQYLLSAKETISGKCILKEGTKCIADSAFRGCTGLTSIEIPNSVTSIGFNAFSGCTGLTSIEIPSSVISIGDYAFFGCTGLTSIEILNSVTRISEGAFENTGYYNESGNWENDVLYIGQCLLSAKETISGKCILKEGTKCIADSVFNGCTGLTSIEIPNSVTIIGNSAFWGCTGLTSIEIPNSVTSIGNFAFTGCTGLTSIEIPNSVTSIGYSAFRGCTGLTSIEIPSSVKKVSEEVFTYLAKGSIIYCETQKVADLLQDGTHYYMADTTVLVDASKFE